MEEYASMEVPEENKSKYNSAFAQLYRLDALWQDAHKHGRQIDYKRWNEDLDRIWLELSADVSKEQKEDMEKIEKKLKKLFLYVNLKKLRVKVPILYSKVCIIQKDILKEKEEYLRLLLKAQGKGAAYEEDIDDYMD